MYFPLDATFFRYLRKKRKVKFNVIEVRWEGLWRRARELNSLSFRPSTFKIAIFFAAPSKTKTVLYSRFFPPIRT